MNANLRLELSHGSRLIRFSWSKYSDYSSNGLGGGGSDGSGGSGDPGGGSSGPDDSGDSDGCIGPGGGPSYLGGSLAPAGYGVAVGDGGVGRIFAHTPYNVSVPFEFV